MPASVAGASATIGLTGRRFWVMVPVLSRQSASSAAASSMAERCGTKILLGEFGGPQQDHGQRKELRARQVSPERAGDDRDDPKDVERDENADDREEQALADDPA